MARIRITRFDALIIVDMQRDFMPGGALPVPEADTIVPIINRYIQIFENRGATVVATRDWHPVNHISFTTRGGPWPPHCIQGTSGAEFHPDLALPESTVIVSKATDPDKEAYSGFDGTNLNNILRERGVNRIFVCGVATNYCVKATAIDGIKLGYTVIVLLDAVKGIDIPPGSVDMALNEMLDAGIILATQHDIE
ncbi:MAG TPA: nicotinamidase [Ignisphaera aggregans]|uniref:nicotinamidase n=1 Tax=Ignisphaera aggregans TaxID=334771 RepID=A0A832YYB0_9CREN|nr:nicotinamidase [Ignisphaera aggregans]